MSAALVDENTLALVDAVWQAVGLGILAVIVVRGVRHGTWRDPLAGRRLETPAGAFAILLLMVAGYFAVQLVAGALLHVPPEQTTQPGSVGFLKIVACIAGAQIVISAGALVWLRPASATVPLLPSPNLNVPMGKAILAGICAGVLAVPITAAQLSFVALIWQALAPNESLPTHVVLQGLQSNAWSGWGVFVLVTNAALTAPLFEETCFRGLLLGALHNATGRIWMAIALSATLFGLIHWSNPQSILPLATFGLILGIVRVRYGLTAAIVAHALFNARTLALALLNPELLP